MSESLVVIDRPLTGCAVLTLNRPKAKNALSLALRREIVSTVDTLAGDGQTRVLILTGAGDAFCAGLDLKELGSMPSDALALGQPALDPVDALQRFPGPVIGAINGVAVTGGFELALACDVLVCSRNARFADTHARIGVLPGWGLSQKLSRAIGLWRAKELSLTGNYLPAEKAEAWGLVNRVVEPERLMIEAGQLAAEMLSVVPKMLVGYRRLIDEGFALPFGEAMALEAERVRAMHLEPAELERRRHGVHARGRQQIGRMA